MGQAIQQRTGQPLAAEDLRPLAEGQVGGHDHAGAFAALTEEAEEIFCGILAEGYIAQLVADDEIGFSSRT